MSLLLPALFILFANLYGAAVLVFGIRQMRGLKDIDPLPPGGPMVTIIVPACNEEHTIEPALRTLLALQYEPCEIIVINDRSTDRTSEVLARVREEYPRLLVHEIRELPEGWLGKNHALHQGAMLARGEFLLFTDADILFEKSTLARAMRLMIGESLDHLSLIFRNIASGLLLNSMMIDAGGGLFLLFRPWKVRDPAGGNFMGVGAFNLVRREVYLNMGGHEQLRMHPIDDIMLGKLIKQSGFRQECLLGQDFLRVHWYDSPQQMIRGLMKNIFALYDFRVSLALAAVAAICLATIFPPWGALLLTGPAQTVCLLTVLVRIASFAFGARLTGVSYKAVPFSFITPYITVYIIILGMASTLRSGGITWRGTHYPLSGLQKNKSLLSRRKIVT